MSYMAQVDEAAGCDAGRPRKRDPAVVAAAVAAFASEVMRRGGSYVEGVDEETMRGDLGAVMPIDDFDGMELAQAMNRRFGYALDGAAVELMAGWGDALGGAHDAAVRAWAAATAPEPPFTGVARAAIPGGWRRSAEPVAGTAYRTAAHDARAACLFVPDDKRGAYLREGAFAGGQLVDWESVTVTGAATQEDLAAFQVMHEAEARSQRHAAYQRQRWDRDKAFRDAVDAAAAELGDAPDADLAAAFDAAATAMAGPAFDPFSVMAARAGAALRVMQERAARKAFASGG